MNLKTEIEKVARDIGRQKEKERKGGESEVEGKEN